MKAADPSSPNFHVPGVGLRDHQEDVPMLGKRKRPPFSPSTWLAHGMLALFAVGTISTWALASRPTYDYAVERFRLDGSATGTFVDEFDDNQLAPNWSITTGAAFEAGGVARLTSPGTPGSTPGIPAFETTTVTLNQSVREGRGGFHASVTFKRTAVAPGEILFLQLTHGGGVQTFGVGNLGSYTLVQADTEPLTPNDIRTSVASPSSVTGDIVVRIDFDDATNLVTSSFSLDGGVQFQMPFDPIRAFRSASSGLVTVGVVALATDSDGDGIADDGDFSGQSGDHPCRGGAVINCDDNCPSASNPDQRDVDADGVGDACERGLPVGCGNGRPDAGEQCDNGGANGGPGSCCSLRCTLLPAGSICRRNTDSCDVSEVCNGLSSLCPSDVVLPDGAACNDGSACSGADRCSGGACEEGSQCSGISVLDADTVGRRPSLRIRVRLRDTSGTGVAQVVVVGAMDIGREGTQVTKRIRRRLTQRNHFQTTITLRPNQAGREALVEAGSSGIGVRVEIVVTDRNGVVTTLAESYQLVQTSTFPGSGARRGIIDRNHGIQLTARRRGTDLVTIRWQVSRRVIQAQPTLYEFQLWLDDFGEWNPFLGTNDPSDGGIPVVARLPFDNTKVCLRMVALLDDTIIGSGTSGNEGPCLR